MSILSRSADTFYSFRFLSILSTAWKDMKAYELGLIDENGKAIKKAQTSEEKAAFTLFHRLVFNIKRLLNKVPLGKSKIASYAAALLLLKETFDISDKAIDKVIGNELLNEDYNKNVLNHEELLEEGSYLFLNDVLTSKGEWIPSGGISFQLSEDLRPNNQILGVPVYKYFHPQLQEELIFTTEDVRK